MTTTAVRRHARDQLALLLRYAQDHGGLRLADPPRARPGERVLQFPAGYAARTVSGVLAWISDPRMARMLGGRDAPP